MHCSRHFTQNFGCSRFSLSAGKWKLKLSNYKFKRVVHVVIHLIFTKETLPLKRNILLQLHCMKYVVCVVNKRERFREIRRNSILLFKHKTKTKNHLFGFFPHYSKKQNKESDSQFDSLPPPPLFFNCTSLAHPYKVYMSAPRIYRFLFC